MSRITLQPTSAQQLVERVSQEQYGEEKIRLVQAVAPAISSITSAEVRSILSSCSFGIDDIILALYPKISDKVCKDGDSIDLISKTLKPNYVGVQHSAQNWE